MNLKTNMGRLRLLAILEGISYLLFGVTMPLKYVLGIPGPNYVVGMAHGWLFMLYLVSCVLCIRQYRWSFGISFWALAASLVPFGTFLADSRIFKPQSRLS